MRGVIICMHMINCPGDSLTPGHTLDLYRTLLPSHSSLYSAKSDVESGDTK